MKHYQIFNGEGFAIETTDTYGEAVKFARANNYHKILEVTMDAGSVVNEKIYNI